MTTWIHAAANSKRSHFAAFASIALLVALVASGRSQTCTGASGGTPPALDCVGGCEDLPSGYACAAKEFKQAGTSFITCACWKASSPTISRACCHFAWKKDASGNYTIPSFVGDCQSCLMGGDCFVNEAGTNANCPPQPL